MRIVDAAIFRLYVEYLALVHYVMVITYYHRTNLSAKWRNARKLP